MEKVAKRSIRQCFHMGKWSIALHNLSLIHGKIKVLKFIDKGAQFTEKFEN